MKHRFEVLDIFRGIFASMVFFFHIYGLPNMDFSSVPLIKNEFVHNSDLFVDFFFVLSGFVITYTHQQMSGASDMALFYKKRFFRLYPLHIIMLLIFVFIELVKKSFVGHIQVNQLNNANNNVFTFFSNLFLLNSVKLPGVTDFSWNIPSWSISAEMASYILFGSVVWLIHRSKMYNSRNYFYVSVAVGALLLLRLVAGDFSITYQSFAWGFLRAFVGFFTGSVCFNAFSATRERVAASSKWLFHAGEVLMVAAMIFMVYNGGILRPYGFVYEILFFCSIYIFAFEQGVLSRLFKKSGFLKKIGTYSYSIYMTHALLISLFNVVFCRILKFPPSAYWYLVFANYLLIYFVAQWSYKHIELKFQLKKKDSKLQATVI